MHLLILLCVMVLMAIQALELKRHTELESKSDSILRNSLCYTCKSVLSTLINIFINPIGFKFFGWFVQQFVAKFLFDQKEGKNISEAYVQMVMEGLGAKTFEPNFFCEVQLPICKNEHFNILTVDDYTQRILSDKPAIIKNNDFINNLYKEIKKDKENGVERETMLV